MCVRNHDCFDPAAGDCLEIRQRILPSVLWMHSASSTADDDQSKIVRVRAISVRRVRLINFKCGCVVQCWKFLSAGQFSEQSLLKQSKHWSHERRTPAARSKQPSGAGHFIHIFTVLLSNGRRLSDSYWIDSLRHHAGVRDTWRMICSPPTPCCFDLVSAFLLGASLARSRRMHRLERFADAYLSSR